MSEPKPAYVAKSYPRTNGTYTDVVLTAPDDAEQLMIIRRSLISALCQVEQLLNMEQSIPKRRR